MTKMTTEEAFVKVLADAWHRARVRDHRVSHDADFGPVSESGDYVLGRGT